MLKRPSDANAPFCPSEVSGTVSVPENGPLWKKILRYAGPGLLVSVGYMDPGNWATAIQGGSQFGYDLLFVVVLSSLAAIVLQCLSMRLGIVTGKDLAVHCREQYSPVHAKGLWLFACNLAHRRTPQGAQHLPSTQSGKGERRHELLRSLCQCDLYLGALPL